MLDPKAGVRGTETRCSLHSPVALRAVGETDNKEISTVYCNQYYDRRKQRRMWEPEKNHLMQIGIVQKDFLGVYGGW